MQLNRLIKELSQENILSPEIKICIVRILSRKESRLMLPEEKARVAMKIWQQCLKRLIAS